ncbi:MAG TPA: LuxR C-terminal-related transcriptional regulator [Streptosporangiaceae bacterium]|nr:LuxR C-terminal-related transcriptional regulator [Streptosporangiaceae bacterium]
MTALLDQVAAAHRDGQAAVRQVPLGYLARVLRAAGPKAGGPKAGGPKAAPPAAWRSAGAAVPGLVEPLTSREMEVLYLLAAGSPNQLIAESLVVTLDTVKKHVTHVLGKLGAANRTEAVARARELGLIA